MGAPRGDGVTDHVTLATFSRNGRYRYTLRRRLGGRGRGTIVFVLLNPSMADASLDDPTSRRCKAFAKRMGFAWLVIVNLFAYRCTRPAELRRVARPVGTSNDRVIRRECRRADLVVVGWGNFGGLSGRSAIVTSLVGPKPMCLGLTAIGQPRHPLHVAGRTPLEPFANMGIALRRASLR